MGKQIYIHYGSKQFNPLFNFPIRNEPYFSKPVGGLWASRENATYGWKDWCEKEQFRECKVDNSFKFVMDDESKIAVISTVEQLHKLPRVKPKFKFSTYCINFEECLRHGIDAIELCWYGDEYEDVRSGDLYFELYEWDCDSIVVLNPAAVVTI